MVSEDPRQPDESPPSTPTTPSPAEPPAAVPPAAVPPTGAGPSGAGPSGAGPSGAGPSGAGPSGTEVLPTVPNEPPEPRWSARAQVRTPDVAEQHDEQHDEEWVDPGRSPLIPVLIAVGVLVLIGLVVIGAVLLLNNRDTPGATTPTATVTPQVSTPAPASAPRTSAAPTATTSAPTQVAIPEVKGLDYDAAAAKLTAAGFVPVRRDEVSGQQPVGKVVGTDPAFGSVLLTGTRVTIIVSKGVPTAAPTTPPATTPAPSVTTPH